MAEAAKNRRSAKVDPADYADKLIKPLREFRREATAFQTTPALQRQGAKVITAEFRKLTPVFKRMGLDVVISSTRALPGTGRAAVDPPRAAMEVGTGVYAEKSAGFDPLRAGLKLADQMKQAEGGAFTGSELKALYDLSPAALHSRRGRHGIVFWRDAKHDFHYPGWQFTVSGALLPGIQEVLRIFKSTDEWRIMRYFLTPRQQLDGRTPLELLRKGQHGEVTAHAQLHEAENSW